MERIPNLLTKTVNIYTLNLYLYITKLFKIFKIFLIHSIPKNT